MLDRCRLLAAWYCLFSVAWLNELACYLLLNHVASVVAAAAAAFWAAAVASVIVAADLLV